LESLTFDIETRPQQGQLSEIQEEELSKKLRRYLERHPQADKDEARRLIMGTSPYFGEIVVIGLLKELNGETDTLALSGTEQEILTRFWDIVGKHRGVFISYNGLSFDVPFIINRSLNQQTRPSNADFINTRRYSKFPHFDVKEVIADWDRFAAPTLRLACELTGVESPKEGEVKAEDVEKVSLQPGGIKKIADYCIRDVQSTFEVYKKLQGYWV